MSEDRQQDVATEGTPRWLPIAIIALAAIAVLGLGFGWTASNHARGIEQALNGQVKSLQQNVEVLTQRLAQSDERNAQMQGEMNVVTDRLKLTQGELATARRQSKSIREDYSKQLSTLEGNVKTELAKKASNEDVTKLGGDVAGVRTDLEATKNNLQMARGEFGTLIARNHEEIDQLRRLGQRDYFEFTLSRKGGRQKVGDLLLELRGTNSKRGQYTLALYVDDMRLEKKNRSINEPIYFYTRGSRQPLELVVNQVGKDKVVGYLSAPKSAGNATASGK